MADALAEMFLASLDSGRKSRTAAFLIFAYDYLLTLDNEINFVWKKKKNTPGFWLHLFNRLAPVTWLSLETAIFFQNQAPTDRLCLALFTADGFVFILQTLCVQILLQLRVRALYPQQEKLRWVLTALCAIEIIVMVLLQSLSAANVTNLPIVSTTIGCKWTGVTTYSSLIWIPSLIFEPVLCILVVWRAWGSEIMYRFGLKVMDIDELDRQTVPELMKAIARESVLYFLAIFLMLVVNTIIWAYPDICRYYIYTIMPWSYTLPSILGSRLSLHMRESYFNSRDPTEPIRNSGFESRSLDTKSRPIFAENHED